MDNAEIARALAEVGELLDQSYAGEEQVQAYLAASETVARLDRPARQILAEEGEEGLKSLPYVTGRIADSIRELVSTGRLERLDQLRADAEPEGVLDGIRGIGNALAKAMESQLGIVTVEELERAAYDGRLEQLPQIGSARARRIRDALAERRTRRPPLPLAGLAPVAELLSVDEEYRDKAATGELPGIVTERYNPRRRPWLPVLHTARGPRRYTALFANTHLAHHLDETRDWVVIYYGEEGRFGQTMVATESRGDLTGHRVVRGREQETREHYQRERAPAYAG
jgi:DNA polymerase (family 10)